MILCNGEQGPSARHEGQKLHGGWETSDRAKGVRALSTEQQKGTRKLERQMAAASEVAGYGWQEALQFPKWSFN